MKIRKKVERMTGNQVVDLLEGERKKTACHEIENQILYYSFGIYEGSRKGAPADVDLTWTCEETQYDEIRALMDQLRSHWEELPLVRKIEIREETDYYGDIPHKSQIWTFDFPVKLVSGPPAWETSPVH